MNNKNAVSTRLILPSFCLTETCDASDSDAVFREISSKDCSGQGYYCKLLSEPFSLTNFHELYQWNQYPVVLNADGSPWVEANLYLMDLIESSSTPNMHTFGQKALELVSFKKFLDRTGINFLLFPKRKRIRPTYAYLHNMQVQVDLGEIKASTAQGRIGTVRHFYRWLIAKELCLPENPPWKSKSQSLMFKDKKGFSLMKEIESSDLKIKSSSASNSIQAVVGEGGELQPIILDEGKLRPLNREEQEALIESLQELKNTTMTLIHYMGLFTGARIQTILTIRVKHVQFELTDDLETIPFTAGPTVGIDTKGNKNLKIFIPRWLYEKLRVYSYSPEAVKRRLISGQDDENQYLFLSRDGNPMYVSKLDMMKFDPENQKRYIKQGVNVRQFMARRIIPLVRNKLGKPKWSFQFHDLRASFGMNHLDYQMLLVTEGKITLTDALRNVQGLLAHESLTTTESYLKYRQELTQVRHLQNQLEGHLKELTVRAMKNVL